MISEHLQRVVLDAGPLIGLLYRSDEHHPAAVRGFRQLEESRTLLVVPLPIVFEVYKWLLQRTNVRLARSGLQLMIERVETIYVSQGELAEAVNLTLARQDWLGSLEDAMLAQTGIALSAPVWTFNYRDLTAFPSLQFWSPS